jgi:hypothetical protein
MDAGIVPVGRGASARVHGMSAKIDDAWLAFRDSMSEPETVPDGWLTAEGIARALDVSAATAGRVIAAGIRKGTVERRDFKVMRGSRLYPVPHYRVVA